MKPFHPTEDAPPVVAALAILGTVTAMLGILLAGGGQLFALGLGAVIAAVVISALERWRRPPTQQ